MENRSRSLASIPDLAPYEELYKHFHSHPELSIQEHETANTIAKHLQSFKAYSVQTDIGGTGLVGVLQNGEGKTVLLRADMDALPVEEQTGLEYASKVSELDKSDGARKPVMHACGHDMHITCLLAAAETLAKTKDLWKGTLIVLFQPNEERGGGAKAMVEDGLYDKVPVPDFVLGQHVMALRAGTVGAKVGTIMASSNRCRPFFCNIFANLLRFAFTSSATCLGSVCSKDILISSSLCPHEEMLILKSCSQDHLVWTRGSWFHAASDHRSCGAGSERGCQVANDR